MQLSQQRTVKNVTFMSATILICLWLPLTSALRCFTCSYLKGDLDDLCLKDPLALNKITDCDKKYCTIMRQESVKPREIVSFLRGCDDEPVFLDKVVADWTFKTYFRSCTKDLCNIHDGVETKDPSSVGSANNTVIAGKNAAAHLRQTGVALFSGCVGSIALLMLRI